MNRPRGDTLRLWCFIFLTVFGLRPVLADGNRRGEWLLPRKDPGNSARSDMPGNMPDAPKPWWNFGGGADSFSWARFVDIGGKPHTFGIVRSGVRLIDRNGRVVWKDDRLGVGSVLEVGNLIGRGVQALVTIGQTSVTLVDVATGKRLWTWDVPAGAYLGSCKVRTRPGDSRFVCFIQNTLVGVSFKLNGKDGLPEKLWEKTYENAWWTGYGPQIVLADMDNDGTEDVVVSGKPGYVGVVDLDTGTMKTQIHYPVVDGPSIGRPYGLLHAIDVDNDGFRDVVMVSCQVEEYVGIVRNVGGKTLAPLWSQFVEQDYPTDNKELRPNITSVADIDGDGKRELVLGLYNVDGDSRWHTVAFSPDTGWKRRGVDLPGRFFHGCYDLDGDGIPELITTEESARRVAPRSTLVVVDGRTGKDRARLDNVSLVIADGHLGGDIGFLAYRATPVYVNGKQPGLLVRLNGEKTEKLLQLRGDRLTTVKPSWTADARMAAISRYPASTSGLDLRRGRKTSRDEPDALTVRVVQRNGSPELVMGLSDNSTVSGRPDWRKPGRLMDTVSQPGGTPSVWVGPDQKPVVLTRSADRNTIYVGRRDKPIQEIRLPFPMYVMDPTSSGATLLPVGKERMQLFVGLQTGVHTLACALFDDSGNPLWRHDNFGPYPRSAAAIAPESGAGVRFFVNDHYNKMVLDAQGSFLASLPYAVPRGSGTMSTPYALPIVGPFSADGGLRIVLAPGLDTVQVLDDSYNVRMTKSIGTYDFEYCGSSVAKIRSSGWDLGMSNHAGIFHCVDLETGASRWTLDLGARSPFAHVLSTCDVDGDGRDNFLVCLPDGRLLALDESNGQGKVLWTVNFPAGVKDAFGADVDGDGKVEIVAITDDGRLTILGAGNGPKLEPSKRSRP